MMRVAPGATLLVLVCIAGIAHGIAAPWLDEPLMRDLWCQTAGEMQIQLLSFTLAGRHLSPQGRLWALSCRDAYARLEVAAKALLAAGLEEEQTADAIPPQALELRRRTRTAYALE